MPFRRRKPTKHSSKGAHDPAKIAQDGEASAQSAQPTSVNPSSSYSSLATTLVDQPDTAPSESRGAATESAWSLLELVQYSESLGPHLLSERLYPSFSVLRGSSEPQGGRLVLGTTFAQALPWSRNYKSVGHLGGEVLAAWLADFSTRTEGTISDRLYNSLQEVTFTRFKWPGTLSSSSVKCDGRSCAVDTCEGARVKLQLEPPLAKEEVRKFWSVVRSGKRPDAHEYEEDLYEEDLG